MLGALVGAGASILGGILGSSSQKKQMEQQIAAQREFAQNGIRWKVEDAAKAGVHPLYALGANTHSFSPIGIGGNPLGEGIANAGQDIGRAIQAKGTTVERAFQARSMQLQLQRGELENQLLASQLARANSPTQTPPAMPMPAGDRWLVDGQGQTAMPAPLPERFGGPLVENVPLERIRSDPNNPHSEPGAVTDVGFARTADGGYAPVPSYDVKQRIEDQLIPEIGWAMRNMIGQNVSASRNRPPFAAPPGKHWEWRWTDQAYYLVNSPNNLP